MISDSEIVQYAKGIVGEGTADHLAQAIRRSKTAEEVTGNLEAALNEIGGRIDAAMAEILDKLETRTRTVLDGIFDD